MLVLSYKPAAKKAGREQRGLLTGCLIEFSMYPAEVTANQFVKYPSLFHCSENLVKPGGISLAILKL